MGAETSGRKVCQACNHALEKHAEVTVQCLDGPYSYRGGACEGDGCECGRYIPQPRKVPPHVPGRTF